MNDVEEDEIIDQLLMQHTSAVIPAGVPPPQASNDKPPETLASFYERERLAALVMGGYAGKT